MDAATKRDFIRELQIITRHVKAELPRKPALNLLLMHGRNDPNQDMDDMGYAGPTLRGIPFCHFTYTSFISISDYGNMHHALTFEGDQLKLVMREEDAVSALLDDEVGVKEIIEGILCRVMYFGDWEFQLEDPNAP